MNRYTKSIIIKMVDKNNNYLSEVDSDQQKVPLSVNVIKSESNSLIEEQT